jgi:hypothetical protein
MDLLPQRRPVEIHLPNVDLVSKLSVIGAALTAIREAHRDDMSAKSWAAINRAEEAIAEAILARNEARLLKG